MDPTSPVDFNLKAKIRVNGKEYASVEEMPPKVREAYARAVGETAVLRSGARMATKLNAKISFNGVEYDSPSDLPVAARRLYHDALATLLPAPTVLSTDEAAKRRRRRLLLTLFLVGALAAVVQLWLRGYFS
jgi:hypothetical protein